MSGFGARPVDQTRSPNGTVRRASEPFNMLKGACDMNLRHPPAREAYPVNPHFMSKVMVLYQYDDSSPVRPCRHGDWS